MTLYSSMQCISARFGQSVEVGFVARLVQDRLADPVAFHLFGVEVVADSVDRVFDGEIQFHRLFDALASRVVCGCPECVVKALDDVIIGADPDADCVSIGHTGPNESCKVKPTGRRR